MGDATYAPHRSNSVPLPFDQGEHMRQHSRSRRALALLLGLTIVAAACGGDDDDSAEDEGGGGEETTTTTEVDPKIAAANEVGDADPSCEGEEDGILRVGEL